MFDFSPITAGFNGYVGCPSGINLRGAVISAAVDIGRCQRDGGICAVIDADRILQGEFLSVMKSKGVDLTTLLVSQPHNQENMEHTVKMLMGSQAIDLMFLLGFPSSFILYPQKPPQGID